jgi:non-heme chloroperoxidase
MPMRSRACTDYANAGDPELGVAAIRSGTAAVGDGVRLNYYEAGGGTPLILVHGWSQSAAMFEPLLVGLAPYARVIAPDLRGHGRSDRPAGGYTVLQLAMDLAALIEVLGMTRPVLLGHSMGCGVIWALIRLFGPRYAAQIIIDQAPAMLTELSGVQGDHLGLGGLFTMESVRRAVAALRSPFKSTAYVDTMFTTAAPAEMRERVRAENVLLPRKYAADLLFDGATRDWRSVVEAVTLPTLVMACACGTYPVASIRWIAERIPDARFRVFTEAERGSHLVFLENPDIVIEQIRLFLDECVRGPVAGHGLAQSGGEQPAARTTSGGR